MFQFFSCVFFLLFAIHSSHWQHVCQAKNENAVINNALFCKQFDSWKSFSILCIDFFFLFRASARFNARLWQISTGSTLINPLEIHLFGCRCAFTFPKFLLTRCYNCVCIVFQQCNIQTERNIRVCFRFISCFPAEICWWIFPCRAVNMPDVSFNLNIAAIADRQIAIGNKPTHSHGIGSRWCCVYR